MMSEKILIANNNEMVNERIGKKSFTGISGTVKITCGISLGLVLGIFTISECITNISSIGMEDTMYIASIIITLIDAISVKRSK